MNKEFGYRTADIVEEIEVTCDYGDRVSVHHDQVAAMIARHTDQPVEETDGEDYAPESGWYCCIGDLIGGTRTARLCYHDAE